MPQSFDCGGGLIPPPDLACDRSPIRNQTARGLLGKQRTDSTLLSNEWMQYGLTTKVARSLAASISFCSSSSYSPEKCLVAGEGIEPSWHWDMNPSRLPADFPPLWISLYRGNLACTRIILTFSVKKLRFPLYFYDRRKTGYTYRTQP